MTAQTLETIQAAAADGKITVAAEDNIRRWLTEARYAPYKQLLLDHIEREEWQKLDDVFWTVIPFGTGGRRGKMYSIGSNAINTRTIGESAQGLADYVREALGPESPLSCAIARDTRHRSEEFAELCAEIMAAAGFTVYFLNDRRSTPELSFAVRFKQASCGIMVTASHNPPSDNAVKVYWSTGGQILPPHDKRIIQRVMNVGEIHRTDFKKAVERGEVLMCEEEVDAAYIDAVVGESTPGPRDLKVLYSPLHGVGDTAILPVLDRIGFKEVELYGPQSEPDGNFPNVPGHVANPENAEVFDALIDHAKQHGQELCIATDPDCDRIGCAAPVTAGSDEWRTLTGNQIGAVMVDYVLEARRAALTAEHFIVQTLVTTQLIRRIGDSYGVRTIGDLLVGFKWIAGAIDENGPEKFVFGAEESHGYMVGTHTRDKDGVAATMLMCELAAKLKAEGQTIHEKLESLFWQHGAHAERTINVQMPGSDGMVRMKDVMQSFRDQPPAEVGGMPVVQLRDYQNNTRRQLRGAGGGEEPLEGPTGDLVILDLGAVEGAEAGNYVAVRPSGTEPKIKFYQFVYTAPEQLADLETAKEELEARLKAMEVDLHKFAGV